MAHHFYLFLHIVGMVLWIGGMFFMLHCLHPNTPMLEGALRPKFVLAVQEKFFFYVLIAIACIWLSGLGFLHTALSAGIRKWPVGWHIMLSLAAVMTLVFFYIRFVLFARAKKSLLAGDMASVPTTLASIRKLVMVNMGLGFIVIAAAVFGR